eukprot:TRINITY_DN3642_c0_g1_i1.p2 TRINITY_DN3642_c0_g1~~TRINITY_DN3642_c0_g1_i1.p2  ORF type:complete len:109 (-),score=30.55 TRINITY_DN3642_c0_g1_i1:472-798(-)
MCIRDRYMGTKLLNRDPKTRIGVKDKAEIKNDPFFKGIDWGKLERKEIKPPTLSFAEDEDDFEMTARIILNDADYDDRNKRVNRVNNFTFIRKERLDSVQAVIQISKL